jgi:hypothetical protein
MGAAIERSSVEARVDLLDLAGFAAAGGIGGLVYWAFVERELITARVRALLRTR